MRYAGPFIQEESGQMAVELAIVTPVILVVLVVIFDMLIFTSECARFDNLAPQAIIANASSGTSDEGSLEDSSAKIQGVLEAEFNKNGSWVSVEKSNHGILFGNINAFQCTFHFVPWPLALSGAPTSIEHSYSLTIDSYIPGKLL